MTHQLVLGLGTNIGDCIKNLTEAIQELSKFVSITAVSPTYITPPWGVVDQPDFYNLCLTATTEDDPQTLLKKIKNAEVALGRLPTIPWGPRLIDIDILFYDNLVLHQDRLNIPHARIPERAFVLIPLRDIAPEWVHPENGKTVAEMATAVSADGMTRLEPIEFEVGMVTDL